MKLFGFGGKKSVSKKNPLDVVEKDIITGQLFYLQFNIKSIKIKVAGQKNDYACKIADIDDKKELFYLTVLGRALISKNDEVELSYDIAQIMYTIKTVVKKNSSEHDLCLEYPDIIEYYERRKNPRVVFRKNENTDIKLVTDPFGGYGVLGRLNNVGLGGFNFSTVKIVEAKSGKELPANPLLLKPSTVFSIIQFTLPGSGNFELSGESKHIAQAGYSLNCGVAFNKLSYGQQSAMEKFVNGRYFTPKPPDYPAFFQKYLEEKAKPPEEERPEELQEPTLADYDSGRESKSVSAPPKKEAEKKVPEEPAATPAAEKEAVEPKEGKKAVRARDEDILLVLFDNAEIDLLKDILRENGFSKIDSVTGFEEAIKHMTAKSFDLIFVDYNASGSRIRPDQFIEILKGHPKLREIPIAVISENNIDTNEKVKLINLKISRVCFRPIKDATISEILEKILGE